MATRMLIDATHAEETRVVVVKGTRLEEFDYETSTRKQLKGNIYLAKVTRVEPSLQAAFVDYGGNRHGFLAFSEIHPDYYQIPVADREALIKQESDELAKENAEEDSGKGGRRRSRKKDSRASADGDDTTDTATVDVDEVGGDDIEDAEIRRPIRPARAYKIQEVIKRRQILLIQVVKEERGNKGAALTTYLSLAGRYCVLMPNTARGGGISRKIANPSDRKRLKSIASSLNVPTGMGVIVRTAGLNRTKAEIKRDYDYLLRLWDEIRELTLKSIAPCMVYEEANLIKRSIRDLYTKEIDEILVEGDEGYRTAKDFMRMLMPSHAKKVQPYRDRIPLMHRYQIEQQFASMYKPEVGLKSGGYIVINPTEALVAIDVNSGRATKEHSIEETAYKTNLEAAEEVSRQLRLRDLAGLIVIDFIDMEENKNNRNVERRLKDCLKADRARIQVGRISPFGLLEMSRQRLRPSLHEASSNICPTCGGSGFVRSTESTALHILRVLEDEGIRERSNEVTIHVTPDVALYLLNQKRSALLEIEGRYGLEIMVEADAALIPPDHRIERTKARTAPEGQQPIQQDTAEPPVEETDTEPKAAAQDGEGSSRKRRRRKRKPKGEDQGTAHASPEQQSGGDSGTGAEDEDGDAAQPAAVEGPQAAAENGDTAEQPKKRRRRGKRGGRRRNKAARQASADDSSDTLGDDAEQGSADDRSSEPRSEPELGASDEEKRPSSVEASADAGPANDEGDDMNRVDEAKAEALKTRRRPRTRRKPATETATAQTGDIRETTGSNDVSASGAPAGEATGQAPEQALILPTSGGSFPGAPAQVDPMDVPQPNITPTQSFRTVSDGAPSTISDSVPETISDRVAKELARQEKADAGPSSPDENEGSGR